MYPVAKKHKSIILSGDKPEPLAALNKLLESGWMVDLTHPMGAQTSARDATTNTFPVMLVVLTKDKPIGNEDEPEAAQLEPSA